MNNFWQRLKNLPWQELFLVSFITTLSVVAVQLFLAIGLIKFVVSGDLAELRFYTPFFRILISAVVVVGMGAFAVYLLEWWQKQSLLNTSSLWALVFCLFITWYLLSLFPLPTFLLGMGGKSTLIGFAIGVFGKGRRYWRRF